jgi:hypothetical protein
LIFSFISAHWGLDKGYGTGLGWGVDRGLGARGQKKVRQGGEGRPRWELGVAMLLDVDERPPPIVKLMDAQQYAQLLATFFMDNSLDFNPAYMMKLQGILEKLNKIYVANLKWQQKDYLFLLQVHIGLVRRICIFVIHLKEYSFLYMAKYLKCVFMKYLVIVTTRSNLSYY